jgi:hypothetical protein
MAAAKEFFDSASENFFKNFAHMYIYAGLTPAEHSDVCRKFKSIFVLRSSTLHKHDL